ncbi:histidine kinase [Streptomyces sp. G-G2]|uniref:sensor histidine kinase n=1 Tax=Streptomyces sp. G-G2 TaxID=3046201 RepID=UPI0024BABEB6|nr:histidine kinase [Streptomyces sp. G-G2]MDJ0381314.1 histidine kinase [Streptomyces sp. G-G2]
MPYFLLAQVVVGVVSGGVNALASLPLSLVAYVVALPLAAVSAVFPLVRPMSVAAVRALCGVPEERLASGPGRSWAARGRASVWWTLHLGVGALVSGMTLAVPPMAVMLVVLPVVSALRKPPVGLGWFGTQAPLYVAPFAGVGLLAGLGLCAVGAGALLARVAPVLLGPTAADRLAAAEERTADLAVRNRLARELHDAVGHALSAVTLQAGAARRVLDTDPEFVREALAAIEDTTRRTVGELDTVLGLLRDGDGVGGAGGGGEWSGAAPAPTLAADLEGLLARCRAAGIPITVRQDPGPVGDWGQLPAIVSREAYRIVQEGLTNALRHGGGPVDLRILVHDEGHGRGPRGEHDLLRELELSMTNPPAGPAGPAGPADATGREPRTGGGRGLRGSAERAALLGGRVEAGPRPDGHWHLRAVLPLGGTPR